MILLGNVKFSDLELDSSLEEKLNNIYAQKSDEFLPTLVYIFTLARWFGIPSYGGKFALCGAIVTFALVASLEAGAIWKLVRLLAGIATNVTDGRGFVARLSGTIFYGNALLSFLLSWKLITSWKKVSIHWSRAETSGGLYFPPDDNIRKRVICVTWFVAVCACVEHMMSMMSATGFDIPPGEYFHRYILSSHGFLLQPHEYTVWVAVPVFITSKLATIFWNFQDLIIILISMGLTSRYHRLNLYVNYLVKLEKRDAGIKKFGTELYIQMQTWRRLREAYVRQASLVRVVDKKLGTLVLLSNLNNFYFICLQLFLGLNKTQSGLVNRMYYFYSMAWLLFRACNVVLAAAEVNDHSRRALPLLYGCPRSSYNIEIKRLKHQLTYDSVALSGMGLFKLHRQLLLEVAAAILKYELVMLQYDG
ncbi:gustatory receptor for sugar taste 64a-like [Pectinophora gossypiella]|uniref:gustatory receptor for sugar taste 64a-like n=1 Tax=Pectinophora gossypiella TaxID=13191 RepID=UPI00214DF6AB|nr:gustatory receptor for sugar taste 64a-like [Pectinophora gossypiella]